MRTRPVNAMIAIAVAILPTPTLRLLDHFDSSCGDGLCSLFPALVFLGGLVAATLVFVGRSARRNEKPAILRLVPFALWALAVVPLFF